MIKIPKPWTVKTALVGAINMECLSDKVGRKKVREWLKHNIEGLSEIDEHIRFVSRGQCNNTGQ